MLTLTYIPNSDRIRIETLKKDLNVTFDSSKQNEIISEIQSIESKRKLLKDCTIQESEELKQFVYDKYLKIIKLGKKNVAVQFSNFLQTIEDRILYLRREELKEHLNIIEENKRNKIIKDEKKTYNKKTEPSNSNSITTESKRSRWSINID